MRDSCLEIFVLHLKFGMMTTYWERVVDVFIAIKQLLLKIGPLIGISSVPSSENVASDYQHKTVLHDGTFTQRFDVADQPLEWIISIPTAFGWELGEHDHAIGRSAPPQPAWVNPQGLVSDLGLITQQSFVDVGWCANNGDPWLKTSHGVASTQDLWHLLTARLPIGPVHMRLTRKLYKEMASQREAMVSACYTMPPLPIDVQGDGFLADKNHIYVEDLSALTVLANALQAQLICHAYGDVLSTAPFDGSYGANYGKMWPMDCCFNRPPSMDKMKTNLPEDHFLKMVTTGNNFTGGIPSVGIVLQRTFLYETCSTADFIYGLASNSQTGVHPALMARKHGNSSCSVPLDTYQGLFESTQNPDHFVSWVGVLDQALAGSAVGSPTLEDIVFIPRGTTVKIALSIKKPYLRYGDEIPCSLGVHRAIDDTTCHACAFNLLNLDNFSLRGSYLYRCAPKSTASNVAGLMTRARIYNPSNQSTNTILLNWVLGNRVPDTSLAKFLRPGSDAIQNAYRENRMLVWRNGWTWPMQVDWANRSPFASYAKGKPHRWLDSNLVEHEFNLGMSSYQPILPPSHDNNRVGGMDIDSAVKYGIIKESRRWFVIEHGYIYLEHFIYDMWFRAKFGPMGSYLIDTPYKWVGELHKRWMIPILMATQTPFPMLKGSAWMVTGSALHLADYSCLYLVVLALWYHLGVNNNPRLEQPIFHGSPYIGRTMDMACCTGVGTPNWPNDHGLLPDDIRQMTGYFNPLDIGLRAPELLVKRSFAVANSEAGGFIAGWAANIYAPLFPFLSTSDHGMTNYKLPMDTWVVPPTTTRWPDHLTTWLGAGDHFLQLGIGPCSNVVNVLYAGAGALASALMKKSGRPPGLRMMQAWSNLCNVGHVKESDHCHTCDLAAMPEAGIVPGSNTVSNYPWLPSNANKCAIIAFAPRGLFAFDVERESDQWLTLFVQTGYKPLTRSEESVTSMNFYDVYRGITSLLKWDSTTNVWAHIL